MMILEQFQKVKIDLKQIQISYNFKIINDENKKGS